LGIFAGNTAHRSLYEADVYLYTRIARATRQNFTAVILTALTLAAPPAYSQPVLAPAPVRAPVPAELPGSAAPASAPEAPAAETPAAVTVRAGDHGNYTRVVFVLPPGTSYRSTHLGDLLVLTFPGAGQVAGMKRVPARILSISGGDNQAAIGLAAGMNAHVWRIGDRVIVDVSSGDDDTVPQPPASPPAPPSLPAGPATPAPHR
jgi:hypothetical protein